MKKFKQATQLPTRGALNTLGKSQRTIADYAKLSPVTPAAPTPNIIQNLAKAK